jgi:palmitoyl transferase
LKRVVFAAVATLLLTGRAHALECADWGSWLETGCRHVVDTYKDGSNALLVSGYQWHLPYDWTPERRHAENEYAWGGGWSRTRETPSGNTEDVFFLVFRDSHRNAQFNLGYAWRTYWGDRSKLQGGLGYSALIVQRPDIANGWPFPAVLPLASVRTGQLEILTSYIPKLNGGVNHGSVLYFFGKIDLK